VSIYSNWYPHDFDTGNDEKIIELEMKHGLEGSGLYHRILEHMGTSNGHSLDEEKINFIAKRNSSKIENPAKVFLDVGLFSVDKDGKIYSESLRKRLKTLDEKHNKRVIAGRKGGKKKSSNARAGLVANKKQKDGDALALHNSTLDKNTEHNIKKPKHSAKGFLKQHNIDWISQKIWEEWIDHKTKLKQSKSERALKANINKLHKFGRQRANELLALACDRGWKDVYEPEANNHSQRQFNKPPTPQEKTQKAFNKNINTGASTELRDVPKTPEELKEIEEMSKSLKRTLGSFGELP
jgi:hypothetical protein